MSAPLHIGLQIALWLGLVYLAYVEIGYLIILYIIAKIKCPVDLPQRSLPAAEARPSLTVLIAAHNEESVIAQKLDNLLAQDYPPELLQIIVASDRSTDRTEEIVRGYQGRGVILHPTVEHGGKIAALRAVEPLISGQVVVFTDADAFFQPGALANLARHFADPGVGAVTGRETRPPAAGQIKGKGEGLYNRIETQVKRLEGKVGSQVLLHGGIFAMRRELLPFVPDHLTHDAIVPLRLVLDGWRILYEPDAVSEETYHLDTRQDWTRRIRTVMQAYQSYLYVKEALNPFKTGVYALQVWSHRFMRWFVFPVLLLVLAGNLLLAGQLPLYLLLLSLQLLCYLLALIGFLLDRIDRRPAIFYFPFYFVYIHLAAFYAILLTWGGRQVAVWRPAQRLAEAHDAN